MPCRAVFRIRNKLNPDPAKHLNPDPEDPAPIRILANLLTLSKNNIKLIHNYTVLSSKEVI